MDVAVEMNQRRRDKCWILSFETLHSVMIIYRQPYVIYAQNLKVCSGVFVDVTMRGANKKRILNKKKIGFLFARGIR